MNVQPDEVEAVKRAEPFMVGVGASAGGLEAIMDLFRSLPVKAPATYVIVQHLSPTHKSLLSTLVSRETHLKVVELAEETDPELNVVYTTPPNRNVIFENGVLKLAEGAIDPGAPKPSIDKFFLSLAESVGEKAVGIILSGTGRDGAFGVQAIRGAGGITIAQDQKTAKYDGMPVAAVETGCVDLILSSAEIGSHLGRILDSPRNLEQFRPNAKEDHPLSELLQIVLARTRVDFRDYKPTTIRRRLEKRMIACGAETQLDYLALCRANPHEVDSLFRDFLISVTWFFRDPKEFGALRDHLARLGENHDGEPMRIWITGCATGEEAYTVGILCAEALGGIDKLTRDRVQIFATDIDSDALEQARKGVYARAALDHVPEEYFETYFKVVKDSVTVRQALKDVVIFSYHNVCQDPPFIHVDLVCCRNLLIYFNTDLQQKVLSRLHYSLSDSGVLFLGTAETVSVSDELFLKTGDSANIFRKRTTSNQLKNLSYASLVGSSARAIEARDSRQRTAGDDPHKGMFDSLARVLGPNSVLTSDDHRILRVYGDIGRYVTMNERTHLKMSLAMLMSPLSQEARTLATVCLRSNERRRGVIHRLWDDRDEVVRLEAYPLVGQEGEEKLALIVFTNWIEEAPKRIEAKDGAGQTDAYLSTIERELEMTREALQQTIEELETSNEELQSSNEELQSTNEELQATNEEMETSNEELQSTNEELITVNEELQISTNELTVLNDELNAILSTIATPLLVIDSALQIVRASDDAVRIFGLVAPLEMPHLSQCTLPHGFPHLVEIANEALRFGHSVSRAFEADGLEYYLKCAPVTNAKGQMKGVTIAFMATEPVEAP